MKAVTGRSPSGAMLPIGLAAKMLGVSVSYVHAMCRKGILTSSYLSAHGQKHFSVHEIAALAEIRHQKLDLAEVASIATRAFVVARANERRLDELFRLLGLKRKTLSTQPEDVVALHEEAIQLLGMQRQSFIGELEEWAGNFYAVDEAYLSLLAKGIASEEPWKVFLELANKLVKERSYADLDAIPDLKHTYDHLETARSHLRTVSYMYCRSSSGINIANDLFGTEKITDKLLSVLFPS